MANIYLAVGGGVVLTAILICLVYLGIRLKSANAQKHLRQPPSILADRMADVIWGPEGQPSPEGRHPPPARRRRQTSQFGGLRTVNSPASDPSRNDAYFVPQENFPLLGPEPVLLDEEKGEIGSWSQSAGVSRASDVETRRTASRTQSGGVDEGDDSRSRKTTVSEAPTNMSATDEALLGTFMEVMSEGLAIKIHRPSGRVRKVVLWLKDRDTLVWSTKRTLGVKKWHKLYLKGVTRVQVGKGSELYNSNADDTLFFLLVLGSGSLGLEASSELERDALVQGFTMLVEDLRITDNLSSV